MFGNIYWGIRFPVFKPLIFIHICNNKATCKPLQYTCITAIKLDSVIIIVLYDFHILIEERSVTERIEESYKQ